MTRLRKMMLEELQRRNFSEDTMRRYIRTVENFARHFNRPPDRLDLRHIREYQAHLLQKRKLSSGSVTNHLAALRFFYIQTLKKAWSVAETPYPKKNHHLPAILSQEEVARLIDAAGTPFHRTLLMTLYATGLRRAEVTHLKVSDIDSKRMVIHVRGGRPQRPRCPAQPQAARRTAPALASVARVLERSSIQDGRPRHKRAQAIAALCVGGLVVARAMFNRAIADELREACMAVALTLGGWDKKSKSNAKKSQQRVRA
jgi:site-specific recombinase XerD